MNQLVELNSHHHGALKVLESSTMTFAKQQHLSSIRVTEVTQSVCNFPVLVTRVAGSGNWSISGVTGLELGANLFVEDDQWQATYMPKSFQSYPFYLMQTNKAQADYVVGADVTSDAFSETDGQPLFDDKGKATLFLNSAKTLLEDNIKNDILTYQFVKTLDELDLLKPIDLLVNYNDGTVNTLTGMHTVDEDRLQSLAPGAFEDLHKNGYLAPIYAMLISLYQLNTLVNKHNERNPEKMIAQIKMQVPRSDS